MNGKGSIGVVVEERGEFVRIRLLRRHGCRGCALEGRCGLLLGDSSPSQSRRGPSSTPTTTSRGRGGSLFSFLGSGQFEVLARNEAGAKVGDYCLVQLRDPLNVVRGSFFLYLVPGGLFILGLYLGGKLSVRWGLSEGAYAYAQVLAQLLGGLILMGLGFLGAMLWGWLRRSELTPVVTKVIKRGGRRRS